MDEGARVSLELDLPVGERRESLLQALARVIQLRGFETFVCAPLLLPSTDFFPDEAARTLDGAGVLILRLLRYARLHPLPVRLSGFRERSGHVAEGVALHDPRMATAAWYAGVNEGVCQFGLELSGLRNDEKLIAALAHEVSHAYRDRHMLVVRDREIEEKLTDLTAVFLGFGVFLLNASHRVESGGYAESGERLLYQRQSLGYLSPAEFALLLSAQVVARGLDARARRRIRDALAPNHAHLFELGVREFSRDASALRAELGVPEPEQWPEPWPLAFDALDLSELTVVPPPSAAVLAAKSGAIGFRVVHSQATLFGALSVFVCLIIGWTIDLRDALWFALFAAGLLLGGLFGAARKTRWCSSCRARLRDEAESCAECGVRFVDEIRSFDERLAAEEQYRDAHRKPESANRATRSEREARADPRSDLVWALFFAWLLQSGLARAADEADAAALAADREQGRIDVRRLLALWDGRKLLATSEAFKFMGYYAEQRELRGQDLEILETAHKLAPDLSTLRRFSAILSRRLEDFRARSESVKAAASAP